VSKRKHRRTARVVTIAALVTLVVTVVGCGGSSKPVAAVPSSSSRYQTAVRFSECMRTHGVPDFPDPKQAPGGGIGLAFRAGAGATSPNSPAFKSAQQACRSLLPNGGNPPKLTAGQRQQFLDYAACMRSHGVPNFPDPNFGAGGVQVRIGGAGVDPSSPAFKTAQQTCRSKLPQGAVKG